MRMIACILAMIFLLSVPALAVDTDGVEQALPEAAREIMGDITVQEAMDGNGLWQRVWQWCEETFSQQVGQAARSACVALAVTLLCSVAAAISIDGKTPEYMLLGGALAIMAACAGDMRSFLAQVQTALGDLSDFSKALLPCLAAAAAAGGHGAAGAARYTASALFLDILMTVGIQMILPMIFAYVAAATANAALPNGALGGPVKLIGWACTTLLTALTTVFTLALSLTGVIAGSADKVAGSLTKTAISAALPVVGSVLADAAETYLAGAALLRGAVGAFGLAAVLCVCAGPFLSLGLHYLLFKAASCIAEPFADTRLAKFIGSIGTAYGMALGLIGSAGAMLFVSIVLSMESVTG